MQLRSRGGFFESNIRLIERGFQRAGDRIHLAMQHQIDCGCQYFPIHADQFDRVMVQRRVITLVARQRVGIPATSLHEQGDHPGIGFFQRCLSIARIIPADL